MTVGHMYSTVSARRGRGARNAPPATFPGWRRFDADRAVQHLVGAQGYDEARSRGPAADAVVQGRPVTSTTGADGERSQDLHSRWGCAGSGRGTRQVSPAERDAPVIIIALLLLPVLSVLLYGLDPVSYTHL